MKWTKEEYIDLLTFKHPPREMFVELFGPLIGLPEEWIAQGAAPGQLDLTDFCFDTLDYRHVGQTGQMNGFPKQILEETVDYIIERDSLGRTVKMCKATATIPLPLDFPVKDMDGWRKMKHMFEDSPARLTHDMIDEAVRLSKEGVFLIASIPGGFDILRELMGEENCCVAFYEDKELIWDILGTISRTGFRVLEELSRHVRIDQLFVHEDMAGKHAPLVGPNIVAEFIAPYYRKMRGRMSALI